MKQLTVVLVNWGMGAAILGIFAVVCIVISVVIYSMVQSEKRSRKKEENE